VAYRLYRAWVSHAHDCPNPNTQDQITVYERSLEHRLIHAQASSSLLTNPALSRSPIDNEGEQ